MPAKITQVQESNLESLKRHEINSPAKSIEKNGLKKSEQISGGSGANFKCSQCEKSFKNSISLQRHEIDAHAKSKTENTNQPGKGWKFEFENGGELEVESFDLRLSESSEEDDEMPDEKNVKKFDISQNDLDLKNEKEAVGQKISDEKYFCAFCDKIFSTLTKLKRHNSMVHEKRHWSIRNHRELVVVENSEENIPEKNPGNIPEENPGKNPEQDHPDEDSNPFFYDDYTNQYCCDKCDYLCNKKSKMESHFCVKRRKLDNSDEDHEPIIQGHPNQTLHFSKLLSNLQKNQFFMNYSQFLGISLKLLLDLFLGDLLGNFQNVILIWVTLYRI